MCVLIAWVAACSNESESDPIPDPDPDDFGVFMDTASIKSVALNLINYIPTWEELERFTDDAERLPIPTYEKRALAYLDPTGQTNLFEGDHMRKLLEYNQSFVEEFGGNMSSALISPLPPFFQADGSEIPFPIPLDILDEKLRAATVSILYEKTLGLPVTLVNFYPPHIEREKFDTKQEFENWFEVKFLPEKEAEAKAGELMKAEKYMPWPLEFELFITDIGGIGDEGFLEGASDEEILSFAEDVKTRIFNTVRAHYNGNIVAHLYNNYYQRPQAHFWDQMSYSEFDELHFAIFPAFDVEGTNLMLDEQLVHYQKIIENSGNIPWIAAELSVFEWYVEDGKLEEYEKALYETILTRLENSAIPPKGVSPAGGYMKTEAARNYIREFFASH